MVQNFLQVGPLNPLQNMCTYVLHKPRENTALCITLIDTHRLSWTHLIQITYTVMKHGITHYQDTSLVIVILLLRMGARRKSKQHIQCLIKQTLKGLPTTYLPK